MEKVKNNQQKSAIFIDNSKTVTLTLRSNTMELLIKDIKSAEDFKLFTGLAKRLGLKTTKLSLEEKEDIGLSIAINKGRKSGYTDEDTILATLHKIQGK